MDWVNTAVTLLTVLIGSGLIQFFFQRKDKKKEDEKKDGADALRKEFKEHLSSVNADWKEKYCDKNRQAVENLKTEVFKGLEEREKTGLARYEEHRETIEELRKVVMAMADDAKERGKLEKAIAQGLMALTHDKLVYLGKCYQRRGAITLAEKNNLTLMYKPYHDGLGGNSDGEGYYTFCMNLPVVTDEEARKMDDENKQEVIRQLANI